MSNTATDSLDPADRRLIFQFFSDFIGKQGDVARAYKLDPRKLTGRLLTDGKKMSRSNASRLRLLAADLRHSQDAVLLKAGIVDLVSDSGTNAILLTARQLTNDQFFNASFNVLLQGFERIRRIRGLEAATNLLPEILYVGYRFCDMQQFCNRLKVHLLPQLESSTRPYLLDDLQRWLTTSQAACALNEGHCPELARELFASSWFKKLSHQRDLPAWAAPQLLRNEAHYWAWYHSDNRSLSHAMSLVNEALQADKSSIANISSVAHSRCDLLLSRCRYADAWDAIASQYFRARVILSNEDFRESVAHVSAMHAYSVLLSGTIARCAVKAAGYNTDERDHDIATLKRWLDRFGGVVECSHAKELPLDPVWAPAKLQQIVQDSRRPVLSRSGTLVLRSLIAKLT